MDINKILSSDLLDIVFEGRNKQYGAYDLRKTYNGRLTKALLYTGAIAVLVFFGSVFANKFQKRSLIAIDVGEKQLAEIKKNDVPPPRKVPPPPPPQTKPPPRSQIKFTSPIIKKDNEVKTPPPEIKEDQAISKETVKSDVKAEVATPVEPEKSNVVEKAVGKKEAEPEIFRKVEIEAGYKGDWGMFLVKILNAALPGENGAPDGTYTAIVKFVVSVDGSVSDVECVKDPGYGICAEAIRAIKQSGKWTPAQQNGRQVKAYRSQPVIFVVQGE